MLKTYYLINLDLKIVLTTVHRGEGGKNHYYRRERANKLNKDNISNSQTFSRAFHRE
jgi:hypothetical protein